MESEKKVIRNFNKYTPTNGHILLTASGASERKTQGGIFIPDGVENVGSYYLLAKVFKTSEDCPEEFKEKNLYVALRTFGDTNFMSNHGIDQVKALDDEGNERVVNLLSVHYSQLTTLIKGRGLKIKKGKSSKVISNDTPKIQTING